MSGNLAELCSKALWEQCCAIRERTPMVRLRNRPDMMVYSDWDGFFRDVGWHLQYDILPPLDGRSGLWRKDSLNRKAWVWFAQNEERIVDAYIRKRWSGDLRAAMKATGHYEKLHEDYLRYFEDRRNSFLEQEEKALAAAKAAGLAQGKTTSSHGGVANLLRVLTKTMIAQGSSIQTIARVQYAVCIQAGIMLPNEFLTDVLVADAMMEGQP